MYNIFLFDANRYLANTNNVANALQTTQNNPSTHLHTYPGMCPGDSQPWHSTFIKYDRVGFHCWASN